MEERIRSTTVPRDVPTPLKRGPFARATRSRRLLAVLMLVAFVAWAHWGSGFPVFHSQVATEPGWPAFREKYDIDYFGKDGQFVRAVQNGYNLVTYTYK